MIGQEGAQEIAELLGKIGSLFVSMGLGQRRESGQIGE
jgi:hypothetical protein